MVSSTSPRTPCAEISGTACGVTAADCGRGASAVGVTGDVVRAALAACAGGVGTVLLGGVVMLPFARSSTLSVGRALSGVATMGLAGGVLLGVVMTSWLVVTRGALALPEFAGTTGFTGATGLADTALSPLSLPPPPPQAARRRARAATLHDRCAGVFMDGASRNVVPWRRNVAECRGAKLRPKAWGCNASCGRHRLLRVDL